MLRVILFFVVLLALGWFVNFQFNPGRFCEDHPDPSKSEEYYICQPFDFEIKKEVLPHRPPDHILPGEVRSHGRSINKR